MHHDVAVSDERRVFVEIGSGGAHGLELNLARLVGPTRLRVVEPSVIVGAVLHDILDTFDTRLVKSRRQVICARGHLARARFPHEARHQAVEFALEIRGATRERRRRRARRRARRRRRWKRRRWIRRRSGRNVCADVRHAVLVEHPRDVAQLKPHRNVLIREPRPVDFVVGAAERLHRRRVRRVVGEFDVRDQRRVVAVVHADVEIRPESQVGLSHHRVPQSELVNQTFVRQAVARGSEAAEVQLRGSRSGPRRQRHVHDIPRGQSINTTHEVSPLHVIDVNRHGGVKGDRGFAQSFGELSVDAARRVSRDAVIRVALRLTLLAGVEPEVALAPRAVRGCARDDAVRGEIAKRREDPRNDARLRVNLHHGLAQQVRRHLGETFVRVVTRVGDDGEIHLHGYIASTAVPLASKGCATRLVGEAGTRRVAALDVRNGRRHLVPRAETGDVARHSFHRGDALRVGAR